MPELPTFRKCIYCRGTDGPGNPIIEINPIGFGPFDAHENCAKKDLSKTRENGIDYEKHRRAVERYKKDNFVAVLPLMEDIEELLTKAEERDQIYEELQKLKEALNEYEISEEPDLKDNEAMVKYITGKVPMRGECPYCHQKGLCRSCLKRHVYIHRNLTGG